MLGKYVAISRPRFWIYLLGPLLIGGVAAQGLDLDWVKLLPYILFFTYPANLLIYGFNDVFDYETDKHNQKKKGYEKLLSPEARRPLMRQIAIWGAIGMLLVYPATVPQAAKWAMTGFYFFGLFYSVPPIRAKTKPFLDAVFNVLYIFPALVSYGLLTGGYPPVQLFLAGWLWCMAMHAYSAIPDISADKKAKIATIATRLSTRGTIIFCWICYLASAALSYSQIGWFSIAGAGIYSFLMILSLNNLSEKGIFKIYKHFPAVNLVVGTCLFLYILLIVKN